MTTTPHDDDYRELIEEARDAVRELLVRSEPDAWLQLRASYSHLRAAVDRDDQNRERAERDRGRDERYEQERQASEAWDEQHRQARRAWDRLPAAARESLLLRVLGDERLIIRQLEARINAEGGCAVYASHVRNLLTRMLRAGQLEREPETFNKTHMRYRYFRKRMLDGPIVELERAYQEGGE